ncbi:hypothetical protein CsSME_00028902 [Camellia sinensis var. sinensis]
MKVEHLSMEVDMGAYIAHGCLNFSRRRRQREDRSSLSISFGEEKFDRLCLYHFDGFGRDKGGLGHMHACNGYGDITTDMGFISRVEEALKPEEFDGK